MNGSATRNASVLAVATLWQRELVQFVRDKGRVTGALGTPLLFWLLIGSGFNKMFRPGAGGADAGYAAYFFPGIVVMILLFTAIFSTFSVIDDRQAGFLQGVLVAPVARGSIVLGKVLGGATLALIQALLILPLGLVVGIPLHVTDLLAAAAVLMLVAVGLTGLGFALAWRMASTQGFHSIMNLLLMPMWLLSGAVFPADTAPGWLRLLIAINPLTYGVAAVRWVVAPPNAGAAGLPSLKVAVGVSVLFAVATLWASLRAVRRPGSGGAT